jgi:chlorophyll synthase
MMNMTITMRLAISVTLLAATAHGFSPTAWTTARGRPIQTSLSLLPSQQQQQQQQLSNTKNQPPGFFPFAEKSTLQNKKSFDTALRASGGPNKEADDGSAGVRQLLGLKGASAETNIWKIRLQLTKPVTWIPLVWGVMCGAAASGNYHWIWNPFDETDRDVMLGLSDASKGFVAMILAGPFLTGYTQTINDWYDREIDAINEPYRPIPSGAIGESDVIAQIWFLLLGGLGIAYGLDVWAGHDVPTVLLLSIFGSFISYIYSAPPLKLKQNGWAGNYALGASYISLPWWCGQAVFGTLDRPVYFVL